MWLTLRRLILRRRCLIVRRHCLILRQCRLKFRQRRLSFRQARVPATLGRLIFRRQRVSGILGCLILGQRRLILRQPGGNALLDRLIFRRCRLKIRQGDRPGLHDQCLGEQGFLGTYPLAYLLQGDEPCLDQSVPLATFDAESWPCTPNPWA